MGGQLGIRQDSEVTSKVLASGEQGGVFHFGSGYFNLTAEYCHQMMHSSKAGFRVLMAHPEANGFLGARGPAGGIPHAYTAIARGFWNLLTDRGLQTRIDMVEWKRPEWTFHAKGTLVFSPWRGASSAHNGGQSKLWLQVCRERPRDPDGGGD